MKPLSILLALVTLAVTSGCATKHISLEYQARSAGLPPDTRPLISIGYFNDKRGRKPTYLGGNRAGKLRSTEPLTQTVTRAFEAGLVDRGLFGSPGIAPYTLSGTIKHLSTDTYVRRDADMVIEVVLKGQDGHAFYVRTFTQRNVESYAFAPDSGLRGNQDENAAQVEELGSRTLTELVDKVIDDIQLLNLHW